MFDVRGSDRRWSDRGQAALIVVVATMVVVVFVIGALAELGRSTAAAARAQTAADAAALSSVSGGRADAERLASAHGATIVSWRRGPGLHEVTVTVVVDGVEATARASNAP